ncbi:TadE family protein [Nocardioides sp. YIM 152315]|uniref:TadE family protein n=1 Tax=Nocardioides sp. YIM 152315 TaxID=3031760 RepID=UPI0023DBE3CB|nr:TadE family protein [Nocardioides sp. YIM 152315]MDF1603630.1 pilus assembly protein [Nocardioides sp. YIM 152315]
MKHPAPRASRADQRGAATAELAMVLPLLIAATIGLVWLLAVGSAQVRAVDAARETARAVARGDEIGAAVARGEQVAPPGSRVSVDTGGGEVVVTVVGRVSGPGGLFDLPHAEVSADAVAVVEETASRVGSGVGSG